MQIFPNVLQEFVRLGIIRKPWIQYLQQFTVAPPNFTLLKLGTSPFKYEAAEPGYIFISGTPTKITLTRGSITIDVSGTNRFVPVGINDIVEVTFSGAFTAYFIPMYGANTTS